MASQADRFPKFIVRVIGPVAQLNRASHYGCEGYRFESCRGHKKGEFYNSPFLYVIKTENKKGCRL